MAFTTPVALSSLAGSNGFRLDGATANDQAGSFVAGAGDVNGDGFADVIIGASGFDPISLPGAGASYVVFGKASGWTSPINLSTLDGTTGFRVDGASAGDSLGGGVATAGDVNGDGFADIIVGAGGSDSNGSNSGSSYVVFGKASGFSAVLAPSTLNGSNGFRLSGVASGDTSGISVASAADVNGDGFADLIIGASLADPNGSGSGASYVVFGRASGWASDINLATLDGTTGFRLEGVASDDETGRSVASAGDVNGDGFADLIIGAGFADANGVFNAGSSYVVFGKASGWSSTMNLSTLNGSNGFRLDGLALNDNSGMSVAAAGDVNGDGFGDVIIGATNADPNGNLNAGSSYVVFGKAGGWSATMSLSTLDGTNGFRLDGIASVDLSGVSATSAGDVNGDGFSDLIIGAHGASPGISGAGASYVVFGKASGWSSAISLSSLNGTTGFQLNGEAVSDGSGGRVASAGDVDGDGFADIVIAARQADFNGTATGSAYVYFSPATGGATYRGTTLTDILRGSPNADSMTGGGRNDSVFGNAGDDTIDGGADNDVLDGGADNDTASYASASAAVTVSLALATAQNTGGAGTDTLTSFENLIGGAFNDVLTGDASANIIDGGGGNDTMDGGGGIDTASFASAGGAVIFGLLAQGGAFNTGGAGIDRLSNFQRLQGSAFNDTLGGDLGANTLWGGDGHDALHAWGGNDSLDGGLGNDVLYGSSSGTDTLNGGAGDDTYQVNATGTVIAAITGIDTAFVTVNLWTAAAGLTAAYLAGSATHLSGGSAADQLVANSGAGSLLVGAGGHDTLWGQALADTMLGEAGDDVLRGGAGNDVLTGGADNDQLVGGFGADRFDFSSAAEGHDQIFDFSRAEGDRIFIAYAGGPENFAALTVYEIGGSTVVQFGISRIDVVGVTGMAADDFLFV